MMLYVTEQGAELGVKRERLEVRKLGKLLCSERLAELEGIALYGNIGITPQAMRRTLARGIETFLLTRSGSYIGRLCGWTSKNGDLRRNQYAKLTDEREATDLARRIVDGKLKNQRTLMLRYQRRRPHDDVTRALVIMRNIRERLDEAETVASLRGAEGKGAAEYFSAFGRMFTTPGLEWSGRKRRPPPDPINILLSFGYTLLGNFVGGCVEVAGMDPYLGALHEMKYGRPSLALDLMEEWRPLVVDATVLRVFNTETLRPEHFVPTGEDEAPVEDEWEREEAEEAGNDEEAPALRRRLLLSSEGSKRWFAEYERRMSERIYYPRQDRRMSYRQLIREQVYLMARHIKGEELYEPFTLRF